MHSNMGGFREFHVFILFLFVHSVYGLSCFQCGIFEEDGYSCENFQFSTSSEVVCGENQFCSKMIHKSGSVVRGCASSVTVSNRKHEIGCWKTHNVHKDTKIVYTCFCNFDFCNLGHKSSGYLPLIIIFTTSIIWL